MFHFIGTGYFIYIISILCFAFFLFSFYLFVRLLKQKRTCSELEAYIKCTERVLPELRRIKHQHNNMFQRIICYLENEDWDSLKSYKSEILEKTLELNQSNTLQLIKISDFRLRKLLSDILDSCQENGISFRLIISGEVSRVGKSEAALCQSIRAWYDLLGNEAETNEIKQVYFRISAEESEDPGRAEDAGNPDSTQKTGSAQKPKSTQKPSNAPKPQSTRNGGILLIADCAFHPGSEFFRRFSGVAAGFHVYPGSQLAKAGKILEKRKNVIFSNYIDQDHFKLEVSILWRD